MLSVGHYVALLMFYTIGKAWFDNKSNIPYFPIEVSRILASSESAYWSFFVGLLIILFTSLDYSSPWQVCAWLIVMGIAIFDDRQFWLLHMLLVGCLLALVLAKAMGSTNQIYLLCMAMCLYAIRLVFKVGALYFLEGVALSDCKEAALQIMFGSRSAARLHSGTVVAFQLGGLLQWIVLWMVGQIILE
jgi:hypothetical protein